MSPYASHPPAQGLGVLLCSFTQPYQPSPIWLSGWPRIVLSRLARRSNALRPAHSALSLYFVTRLTEGFNHVVTSIVAPVASGWSNLPGGACTHWKAPPYHGARQKQFLA
jgi:hypothetical protein